MWLLSLYTLLIEKTERNQKEDEAECIAGWDAAERNMKRGRKENRMRQKERWGAAEREMGRSRNAIERKMAFTEVLTLCEGHLIYAP